MIARCLAVAFYFALLAKHTGEDSLPFRRGGFRVAIWSIGIQGHREGDAKDFTFLGIFERLGLCILCVWSVVDVHPKSLVEINYAADSGSSGFRKTRTCFWMRLQLSLEIVRAVQTCQRQSHC